MADKKEEPLSQEKPPESQEKKPTEETKPEIVSEEKKPAEEPKKEETKPEESAKPSGKAEKKVRKALSKLGMVKVDVVNRVTMKQKDSYILYVKEPEVYSSPQNPNSFIIFGEITLTQDTIEQLKKEGEKLRTVTEKKRRTKGRSCPRR